MFVFSEPPRTPYDLNFVLFRIPVRVSPWFWLAGLILGPYNRGGLQIVIWIAAFFLGIFCHELGHALVMRAQGHFSWITLYGFGGLASCDRPSGGRYPESWRQIAISAAGPGAGFVLAAIAMAVVIASHHVIVVEWGLPYGIDVYTRDVVGSANVSNFINHLLFVTIVYGILNLLPILPLDGGQIAREALTMILGVEGVRHSMILSMLAAAALALYGAVTLHSPFFALFFGALAYSNFATLQAYSDHRWR
jgi:stage IV sporulation protein FB